MACKTAILADSAASYIKIIYILLIAAVSVLVYYDANVFVCHRCIRNLY